MRYKGTTRGHKDRNTDIEIYILNRQTDEAKIKKEKSLFPSKPEVEFWRQYFSVITSVEPYHIPFEFRNSVQ